MDLFKINVIFELEKDNAFKNANSIRGILKRKYGISYEEGGEISKLITNYQVEKYGMTLYNVSARGKKPRISKNVSDRKYKYEANKLLRRLEDENEQIRRTNA